MKTISINRAPVLTLWAAVVAERLGFNENEALSLGQALAGLNAQAKGRRMHLQLGKFMDGPDKANEKALDRLSKLAQLAETNVLYVNLTGLGCYHKQDVPAWYDKLGEKDRWDVQVRF